MSTLMEELTAIKAVEDKLTANKVANFAYTDHAYNNPLTEADGVETYDVDNEQNIPVANASILKVNTTILTKGWRAQASAITRMLMNHFLGRCSYNLNKVNDLFSLLLTKLMAFMGVANGLATLDNNGTVPYGQLPSLVATVNGVAPDTNRNVKAVLGSDTFPVTIGFLGAVFGRLLGRKWTQGTGGNTTRSIISLVYANGLWVCASDRGVWWSEDGKIWTQGTGDNTTYTMRDLVYANGLWVCGSNDYGMWWSEDGKTWIQGTGDNTTYTMQYLVYSNGLWVCGSFSHGMWWSEDGKTWIQGTGGNTTYVMQHLVYANGIWVCGSQSYGLWWSEDGKSWTQGTGANTTYSTQVLVYANGLWVCGSQARGIWYSSVDDLIADGTISLGADIPLVNS